MFLIRQSRGSDPAPDAGRYSVGILGCGAIGVYLGTCLSSVGVKLTMVGRASFMDAHDALEVHCRERVLTLGSQVVATNDVSALRDVDICLLAVKRGQVEAALAQLASIDADDACLVPLQNGLDLVPQIEGLIEDWRVEAGVVYFNVVRDEQVYRWAVAGPLALSAADPRLLWLADMLNASGQKVVSSRDIRGLQAGKLLLNAINGVCGATGLTTGQLLADCDARWVFRQCMRRADKHCSAQADCLGVWGPLTVAGCR